MDIEKTKLNPCPFCGETDIELYADVIYIVAECTNCCARSKHFATYSEAVQRWNRRTETPKGK